MKNYRKIFLVLFFCLVGVFFINNKIDAQSINPPTIIEPSLGIILTEARPLIKGLTASDSLVNIYIDGIYNGKTDYLTNESGTANFFYFPFLDLRSGAHRIWVIAENREGVKSNPSKVINFEIKLPEPIKNANEIKKESAINNTVNEDTNNTADENDNKNDIDINRQIDNNNGENSVTNSSGLVDESSQKQSKISPNLIIFSLFLLAVIGWILWVNRELIKERKKESEQKNKDNK